MDKVTTSLSNLNLNYSFYDILSFQKNTFALLISNSKYDKLSNLDCCENDLNSVLEMTRIYKFSTITTIINKNKIECCFQIEKFIDSLVDKSLIFIYYTGHGTTRNNCGYIIAKDYELNDKLNDNENVCVDFLINKIRKNNPNSVVVVILDACRTITNKGENQTEISLGLTVNKIAGCFIGYSCKNGTPSLTGRDMSLYTSCFIDNIYRYQDIAITFRNINYDLKNNSYNNVNQESRSEDALITRGQPDNHNINDVINKYYVKVKVYDNNNNPIVGWVYCDNIPRHIIQNLK